MGVTFWYGAILTLGFVLWVSYRLARWFLQSAALLFAPFFLRHLVYPITLRGVARLVYIITLGGAARLVYSTTLGGAARLVYPIILGGDAQIGSLTRLELLLLGLYVATNALCMGLGVKSTTEAATRSGVLSVINLLPLFAGSQLSLVADLLGISLRSQLLLHRCVGMLATGQAILHSTVAIFGPLQGPWENFRTFGAMVSTGHPQCCA
jgi:hypothetical protein